MPAQREEQADIPIYVMPNGDTAGARGAAIEALKYARRSRPALVTFELLYAERIS